MTEQEKQTQTTINWKQVIRTVILGGLVSNLVFMAGTDHTWVQIRDVKKEGESQLPTKPLVKISEVQRFKDIYKRVMNSSHPNNNFLCIICGAKGAGKTAVATLLARELVEEGHSITWLSCQAIATEVLGQRNLDKRTLNRFWDEAPAYSDIERDTLRSTKAAMFFAETLYDAMSGHEGAFQQDKAQIPWGSDEQKIMYLLQQKHEEISSEGKVVVIDGLDRFAENEHLQRILGFAFTTNATGLCPAIVTTTTLDLFSGMKNYYFGWEPLSVSKESYQAIATNLGLNPTEMESIYAIAGSNLSVLRRVRDRYISGDRQEEEVETVAIKALKSPEAFQWINGELGQLRDSETRRAIFYLSVARILLPSERFSDADEMKTYLNLVGIRDQYRRTLTLTNRGFMSKPSGSTGETEVSFLYAQLIVRHAQKPEGFGGEQVKNIYKEMLRVHNVTDSEIYEAISVLEFVREHDPDPSREEKELLDALFTRRSIDHNYAVLCKALGMTAPALKSFNVPQLTSGK